MARERTEQSSPDLFSSETVKDVSAKTKHADNQADATGALPLRRHVLPKNLRNAVKQLSDGELDLLYAAALEEISRRGKSPPNVGTGPTVPPVDLQPKPPPTTEKYSHQRQVEIRPISLTRGQVNAVRAAFKAGITPPRIARQFGLTQSDVRKALASDEPKR